MNKVGSIFSFPFLLSVSTSFSHALVLPYTPVIRGQLANYR